MKALVLDESLEISPHVSEVLGASAVETIVTCSPHEFELAAKTQGPVALRIVNLTASFTAWEVSRRLTSPVPGLTLILLDDQASQGIEYLTGLPGVECAIRPRTVAALEALLKRALGKARTFRQLSSPEGLGASPFGDIVGSSPQLREVFAKIEKVAAGNANACIVGESGTGKELIARAIHCDSARRDRPLVTLDCTAIPEGLMESHLFGHLRGSFTGAVENREGVFSLAHTGTLFIDEISELSLTLQAKLLRVIQTREFVKVGGSKPVRTDIRLITASNQDLRRCVEQGSFREDLYYRIAVVMIQVPPLRERREDVPLLAEHFLKKFSAAHRKAIRGVTPHALDLLVSYHWPGNVRQLENCIEQAVVLCEGDLVDVEALALADTAPGHGVDAPLVMPPGLSLREVEQQYILRTLADVDGNRTRAARILGISLRCLQYKLKAYAESGVDQAVQPNGAGSLDPQHLLGV